MNRQQYSQLFATFLIMGMMFSNFYPLIGQEQLTNFNDRENLDRNQLLQNPEIGKPIPPKNVAFPEDIEPSIEDIIREEFPTYPADFDLGKVLGNRTNEYNTIFEPWKSKAAIHAIEFDEDTGYLALAGGYLYDNEIHIYRLNVETEKFDNVWDSGDQIIQSDVMCLDFGDTDLNDFLEIVAGSSDGHIYVFEQRHIYDPFSNTENMFELVWTSPAMFRVFDVKIEDVDRDYRPDIIAGTWNGLYLFEYDEHSGYPFVDEHWITYNQVWTSDELTDKKIYSIEAGDTNYNGLPEIIAGTRDGTIYIYENGGRTIDLNGEPFPLIRDNDYQLQWTSENYTWTPITSIDMGELDADVGAEMAIIAQGQGLFTLEWNDLSETYDYAKVLKKFADWETFGYWGLDNYADSVVSANNVTYQDLNNVSIRVSEPIEYVRNGIFLPNASVYPYNTGMAGMTDGNFTIFDASDGAIDNSTAIIDFGLDEEGTGSANSDADILITFNSTTLTSALLTKMNISISQDGTAFEQISSENLKYSSNELSVDVDDALIIRKWDWFRYMKISVYNGGDYQIDSIELFQIYNLLTDGLSVAIGPMRFDGTNYYTEDPELDKIIVGTVTGKYIVAGYNETTKNYEILWDSGEDERYSLGAGIWDIEYLPIVPDVPTWRLLGTPYPSFVPPTLDVQSGGGGDIHAWTYGRLNPNINPSNQGNYLIGTENGKIIPLSPLGDLDPAVEFLISDINAFEDFTSNMILSVDIGQIKHPSVPVDYPVIAVMAYNPTITEDANPLDFPKATLHFFHRITNDPTSLFAADPIDIEFGEMGLDETGELSSLLAVSKVAPKFTFSDIDDDGDEDLIFSNGQLYLARNLEKEKGTGMTSFVISWDYFKDVNDALTSGGWGQPDIYDLNHDGILDLILNYAHKNGTTAFINNGDADNPNWNEDKRIFWNWNFDTNMKLLNLTDTRILDINSGTSLDLYAQTYDFTMEQDYVMVSLNKISNSTWWAEPAYKGIDSYLAATYPEVIWTDFSLMNSGSSEYTNLGFHVRESWSTEADLEDWTLSIASGDIDQDGKGEIIVGDYDNNVYLFENLVNNTYKRMYSTFDISHNETLDYSPYWYEDLEGLSGDFLRRVWSHAEHLLADVDLDNDGLKEVVIASDLQIYVFEDKNLTGGDELQFIYYFDLRDSDFAEEAEFSMVEKITSLAYGADLDADNRDELIIAAQSFLFVFNVGAENYQNTENNGFFITDPDLNGRYDLLGNPLANSDNPYAIINALVVGDTDQDGYQEIILGGIKDTRTFKQDGFVKVYECHAGIFQEVWDFGTELTYWNPITDLVLDDQDFDGSAEIIIGHSMGIDVWEWKVGSDNEYEKREIITSSPNYPHPSVSDVIMTTITENDRDQSDMANGKGADLEDSIMAVYPSNNTLYYSIYDQIGESWTNYGEITPAIYGNGQQRDNILEETPSICSHDNGRYYLVWNTVNYSSATETMYMSYYEFGSGWQTPIYLGNSKNVLSYPDIAQYENDKVVITFTYNTTSIWGGQSIFYAVFDEDLLGVALKSGFIQYDNFQNIDVHSGSLRHLADGNYAFVFSALNYATAKPDYDLYCARLNSSFDLITPIAHQITDSYQDEKYPNLAELASSDHSLVVVYENVQARYEDRLGIISSTDQGMNWGRPFTMNNIADGITRIEFPAWNYVTYWQGMTFLPKMSMFGASIVELNGQGFLYDYLWTSEAFENSYTYSVGETTFTYNWWDTHLVYGINPESDWTGHQLLNTEDIDVGDTDADGRREIIAGWEYSTSVYELQSSYNTDLSQEEMIYRERWVSEEFPDSFTALTVTDSNGNGFDEIGIATEHGNVYLKEYLDPSEGEIRFYNTAEVWSTKTYTYPDPNTLYTVDLTGDGVEEILCISDDATNETLIAYYQDGTELWSQSYPAGYTTAVELIDLTGDEIDDIIIGKETSLIFAINGFTGEQLWNTSAYIYSIEAGDYDNDGDPEVFLGKFRDVIVLDHQGTEIITYQPTLHDIHTMQLGNFTGFSNLSLALVDSQGYLRIVYPHNGSIIYESGADFVQTSSQYMTDLVPFDFNADGIEELVFMSDRLHIFDTVEEILLYNSTYYGETYINLFIEDFDGDGNLEIVTQTRDNGVFMEDIVLGYTQWHYQAAMGDITDASIGNFGGSGNQDVLVSNSEGIFAVLDGKTGLASWFGEQSGNGISTVATLNISNSPQDYVVHWTRDGYLGVFKANPLTGTIYYSPIHVKHDKYLEIATLSNLALLTSTDLTLDGMDELIWVENSTLIKVWDPSINDFLFETTLNQNAYLLRSGDLDGTGNLDLVITDKTNHIYLINGDTGVYITDFDGTSGYQISELQVCNANAGSPYHEIVVLYEEIGGSSNVFITWYSNSAGFLYNCDRNVSKVGNFMVSGTFSGGGTCDVAVGFDLGEIIVFRGNDGKEYWNQAWGRTIEHIAAIDMDGNGADEVLFMDDLDDIQIFDCIGGGNIGKSFATDTIWDIQVGDIHKNDSFEEVIINRKNVGIEAYDDTFSLVWEFSAPMVFPDTKTQLVAQDMDSDGWLDVIYQNDNYIVILNGSSQEVMWHYFSIDSVPEIQVGKFEMSSIFSCFAFIEEKTINIISGLITTSLPPGKSGDSGDPESVINQRSPKNIIILMGIPIGVMLIIMLRKNQKKSTI